MIQGAKLVSLSLYLNYETGPIVIGSKQADQRVTISTINSVKGKVRRLHTLFIGPGINIDTILIPRMRLQLQTLDRPNVWDCYDGQWAEQDTNRILPLILLCADRADLFPQTVTGEDGVLQQTS